MLFSDDDGGIVRLWALLNYCWPGLFCMWPLLGVVSCALFKSSLAINSP